MHDIIAQSIGIIAAGIAIFSFQCKKNKILFALQAISGLLFAVNFFMLGEHTAALLNLINLFRGGILAMSDRIKSKRVYIGVGILLAMVYTTATVITFADWLSVLILAAQLVGLAVMWMRNGKIFRIAQLAFVSPAWLVNNIFAFSVGGIITESFSILSIVISLIRCRGKFED